MAKKSQRRSRKSLFLIAGLAVIAGLVIAVIVLRTGSSSTSVKATPTIARQAIARQDARVEATAPLARGTVYLYLPNAQTFGGQACLSPVVSIAVVNSSKGVPSLFPWFGYNIRTRYFPVADGDKLSVALACNNAVRLQWSVQISDSLGYVNLIFSPDDHGGTALRPTQTAGQNI